MLRLTLDCKKLKIDKRQMTLQTLTFRLNINISLESVKSINYGNHSLKKDYHPIAHLGGWDCEKWDVEKQAVTNKIMEWNGMV